jgi:hypothetical protein
MKSNSSETKKTTIVTKMKGEEWVCPLCSLLKTPVRSHVIPRSQFKRLVRNANGQYIQVSADPDSFPMPGQDSGAEMMLCRECEGRFNEGYERRGLPMLWGEGESNYELREDGLCLDNVETTILRMLVLSILWRAHHSEHSMYAHIKIPEQFEHEMRLEFLNNVDLSHRKYAVMLQKIVAPDGAPPLPDEDLLSGFILPIVHLEIPGAANNYDFAMGGLFIRVLLLNPSPRKPVSGRSVVTGGETKFFAPNVAFTEEPVLLMMFKRLFEEAVLKNKSTGC